MLELGVSFYSCKFVNTLDVNPCFLSTVQDKLKEDGDSDVATTVLRVSLICPLGKKRMINPCRPNTCTHLQCFDAFSYLEMNEVKPRWQCPVCNKPGLYENLFIDRQVLVLKCLI